jgi:hypothetical protein
LYLIEALGTIHSCYPPVVPLGALVKPIIVNFLTNMLHYLLTHQVILEILF